MLYRMRQFWFALTARPDPDDFVNVGRVLSPELFRLFVQMQPSEQAHSLAIFRQLQADGEMNRDLLTAALLHDVGKSRFPLRVWDRVFIVVARTFAPRQARAWGQGTPAGWRKALVVAEQHPTWGAEMAGSAGATGLTVELIRRHQDKIIHTARQDPGMSMLLRLQSLDNER